MSRIIVQPQGGLCNRMRTIAGAVSLAEKLNCKVRVLWVRDVMLNSSYEALFAPPQAYSVEEFRLSSIYYKLRWHFYKDILQYCILDDRWIYKYARGKTFKEFEHLVKDKRLYIVSSADILFDGDNKRLFCPIKDLLKQNTIVCNKDTIGIHIRRTDNANAVKFSPTSLFIERVYKELASNPEVHFYLATDDPREEERFKSEFGNKVYIYHKTSLDRNDPIAVKEALIDLYNLSCCRKIFASYYSSFSDVAALWGNIKKEVIKTDL